MKFPIDPSTIPAKEVVQDFKKFALRQNLIDMAIGIIIGSAFSKIVSSLVKDIIMPPLGLLIGGINLNTFKIMLKRPVLNAAGKVIQPAVTLNIGSFAQTIFDFTIIALSLYVTVRIIISVKTGKLASPAYEEKLTKQEELLTQIRDLLAKQEKKI